MIRKYYLLPFVSFINVCHAGTYPPNLADYVVSSDPKRFEQDVKYISVVASCCASISDIYKAIENNENNFITANFEKYKKSIFEIIPQAVAKCVLKIDEFSNVSNDIVKFAGVNEENFTQAEVNAVVLYNWIYQMMKDESDTTKITIDKLAEHIGNNTKINQAKLQKAISDIKEYDKVLKLQQLIKETSYNVSKKSYTIATNNEGINHVISVNTNIKILPEQSHYAASQDIHLHSGKQITTSIMYYPNQFDQFFMNICNSVYRNCCEYDTKTLITEKKLVHVLSVDSLFVLDDENNPIVDDMEWTDKGNIIAPIYATIKNLKDNKYMIQGIYVTNRSYTQKKYEYFTENEKVKIELVIPSITDILLRGIENKIQLILPTNHEYKCTSDNVSLGIKLGTPNNRYKLDKEMPIFGNNKDLAYLDLSDTDLSNVKYMSATVQNCPNLTEIKGLCNRSDTKSIQVMSQTFQNTAITNLDLRTTDLQSLTSILQICEGCKNLKSCYLPRSDLAPQNLENSESAFAKCEKIEFIDFGDAQIPSGGSMKYICSQDKELEDIIFEFNKKNWSVNLFGAFNGCAKLKKLSLPKITLTDKDGRETQERDYIPDCHGYDINKIHWDGVSEAVKAQLKFKEQRK